MHFFANLLPPFQKSPRFGFIFSANLDEELSYICICHLQFRSMQQIWSFQIDCFLWKKSNRGQFNSIISILVETPGQRKPVCKHLRRGGGVYVYVRGRVSRNTFGSQTWLETELVWSWKLGSSDPVMSQGHWRTQLESYQCGMLIIPHKHTHLWSHCILTSSLYSNAVCIWLN